LRSDFLDNA
jgi:hypothetical protein